ncbi:acyltransferase family protein [Aquabacterium sp.]|uniref:acyltransferase family protein n=1 Tax=Aquabacterium sp. TaxID=1872578 RepID=UPI0025BD084F|nr:acyltransferase family protein [Aquabacterium sp.]
MNTLRFAAPSPAHRQDIQLLRALAVLAVLGFHFHVPGFGHGHLGVDVFFVISGYLMSRVILNGLDAGDFRWGGFMRRRARRLLPAALTVMACTTLIAPWVLTPSALQDLAWQLGGALGMGANVVLWQQSGYFSGAAELKPLLHTWSLSVEEQFYLVLPAVLWGLQAASPRAQTERWRRLVVLGLFAASLATCLHWLRTQPDAAFYLLPARAWELLLGTLCALRWPGLKQAQGGVDTAWFSLPLLGGLLSQGWDPVHPRGDALLVCLATAALIVRPSAWLGRPSPWARPGLWLGELSYALYLVHWPLIALARHVWLEGVPPEVNAALLALSFPLAWALWRGVEQPLRRPQPAVRPIDDETSVGHDGTQFPAGPSWRLQAIVGTLALGLGLMGWRLQQPEGERWSRLMQPNHGLSAQCEFGAAFSPRPACRTSEAPRTLVWGDSYAMHLLPALQVSAPQGGLLQATRSLCGPVPGIAHLKPGDGGQNARQCLAFSESVLAQAEAMPSVDYVVLAARWQYYLDAPVLDAQGRRHAVTEAELVQAVSEAIQRLRQAGKKVILVSPPALIGPEVDLGACAERRALGLVTVGQALHADCSFDHATAQARQARVLALLDAISAHSHTEVLHLDALNCHEGACETSLHGTPLYRDAGHLSREGAIEAGRLLHLKEAIERDAR